MDVEGLGLPFRGSKLASQLLDEKVRDTGQNFPKRRSTSNLGESSLDYNKN